jgi:uncharacterized membrane protein YcaP (DUF421 family)
MIVLLLTVFLVTTILGRRELAEIITFILRK